MPFNFPILVPLIGEGQMSKGGDEKIYFPKAFQNTPFPRRL